MRHSACGLRLIVAAFGIGSTVSTTLFAGDPCMMLPKLDLEWRPPVRNLVVNETTTFQLWAIPTDRMTPQSASVVEIILNWIQPPIDLLGLTNNTAPNYVWFTSVFPNDSQFCNLNASLEDGSGFYRAWAQFPPPIGSGPPTVPPEGLLITTFRFRALMTTPSTTIRIDPDGDEGPLCESVILSGEIAACDVKANLGEARVRVTTTPYRPGDSDGDNDVDLANFVSFLDCVSGPGGGLMTDCHYYDFDIDLDVDLDDWGWFQRLFGT